MERTVLRLQVTSRFLNTGEKASKAVRAQAPPPPPPPRWAFRPLSPNSIQSVSALLCLGVTHIYQSSVWLFVCMLLIPPDARRTHLSQFPPSHRRPPRAEGALSRCRIIVRGAEERERETKPDSGGPAVCRMPQRSSGLERRWKVCGAAAQKTDQSRGPGLRDGGKHDCIQTFSLMLSESGSYFNM